MPYLSQFQYYSNPDSYGSYQYVSLQDIVNNYMLMYAGNHSLVNNEGRYKVLFHAKRAIQELNYDAFKEIKVLELSVCDSLRYVLPYDFVNWVRISLYKDGYLMPMTENFQAISSDAYLQDSNCNILFDEEANVLRPENSNIDHDRLNGTKKSVYMNPGSRFHEHWGWEIEGAWYFEYQLGARYGLNTETANVNPTFRIDKKAGVINFDSGISGETVVLEYISDGMEGGDDSMVSVNKMFEKYVYAYINYEMLSNKVGVQEYVVSRARKEKTALFRNAKIRMSNIHPGRLLMSLRGRDKWLK